MNIGVVQMTASADLNANLAKMARFAEEGKQMGADLIVFPEMAYFMADQSTYLQNPPSFADCLHFFDELSRRLGIWLVPGSLREPQAGGKHYNYLPVFCPKRGKVAEYRKIFLFQADLPDRPYQESKHTEAGNEVTVVETPFGKIGLAICFDIRFPELFRSLKKRGAQAIVLPSAFTIPTGKAHWSTLLKARAVENQLFMVAPAQCGRMGNGAETYGHSSVYSPWGEALSELSLHEEKVVVQKLNLQEISSAAQKVNAWDCRREDLFPIR